jgi:hypothetical protein
MGAEIACHECGHTFTRRRSTARYCSSYCRLQRHRTSGLAAAASDSETAAGAFLSVSGHPATPATATPYQKGHRETLTVPQPRALPGPRKTALGIVSIVLDAKWPNMYRLRFPDGRLTDMVNITRARDALRAVSGGT